MFDPIKKIRKTFNIFVFLVIAAIAMPSFAAEPLRAPTGAADMVVMPSFASLADKLLPAVVNVSTTQIVKENRRTMPDLPQFPPGSPFEEFFKDFFDQQMQGMDGGRAVPQKSTALGSGFIIDPSGYIVTNNHVIDDADEITVILHDNSELKAEIVGRDKKMDLALLKVKTDKKLPYVSWGDSDSARVGEWVLAIGNPFGLGGTITAGIISARARDINAGPYDDFIQTDASINRGNSGGPMFNTKGEVVGINTAIFSPSGGSIGIGFAIPSNSAKPVIEQLQKFGHAKRGWLGVRIQGVTPEIAENFNLKGGARGALVAGISPNSPATGKLEVGDIITGFNGKEIDEMKKLPRIVADTDIGQDVNVTFWRKGREQTARIKIAQLNEDEEKDLVPASGKKPVEKPVAKSRVIGLSLSPITQALRQRFEIPADVKSGAVIIGLDGTSNAAEQGIRAGDVIVQVAQEDISSPDEAIAKIEKAKKDKRNSVLLLLNRAGDVRFVALKLEDPNN
ncbi:MAG: Do family serine endopeptidase [Alphaproteobacteria bacterium]|nr:MAG: Do family serine endopeptidase [Alphaproteobacteria bacterium]